MFQGISGRITFKYEGRIRHLRIHFLPSSQYHLAFPLDTIVGWCCTQ